MSNRNTKPRKSTNGNYNRIHTSSNLADLYVIVPGESPKFDPSATEALLRLLLEVRDKRRQQKNTQHNGA